VNTHFNNCTFTNFHNLFFQLPSCFFHYFFNSRRVYATVRYKAL